MMFENATEKKTTEENFPSSRIASNFKKVNERIFETIKKRYSEKDWRNISYEIAIVVALIGLAMFIRVILAYEFRNTWGFGSGDVVWNYYVPFNINNVYLEGFADFNYYYYSWAEAWYNNNWYPYEWSDPINVYDYYSYPPVFLYFLVLTWRPSMSNFWLAFPMVFADGACAGFIYLILREVNKTQTSRLIAFIGGFLMALAPINVVYDGIYWLNPGPVTFLTLIALYFAVKKKWWQTFFFLAIATMTKQNALFFTYPLFMVMLGEKLKNKSINETIIECIMNAMLFIGVCLVLSIPYIFITPIEYGRHMLFPGRKIEFLTEPIDPSQNDCVSLPKSIEMLGFNRFFVAACSWGTYSMLWMILSASFIAICMFWRTYTNKLDNCEFFEWIAIYTIFTHIFMPRGVYKFYTAYYVPMILVALLGAFTHFLSDRKYVSIGLALGGALFLWFNIWLLMMDRWAVPFYLFMVAITIAFIGFIRGDIRFFKELNRKKNIIYYDGLIKTKAP